MKNKIILTILSSLLCFSILTGCGKAKSAAVEIRDHNEPVMQEYAGDTEDNFGYKNTYKAANSSTSKAITNPEEQNTETGNNDDKLTVDPTKSRLLIRTVTMMVETKDLDKVKTDLEIIIGANNGYIESSNLTGTGKNKNLRTLTYTIRVPANQLDAIITAVGNNCNILSSSEKSTDVTLEYVDTKARVESLRVEYEQLMNLLKKSEDLNNIIMLQNRLTEVRYQIESYESRLRVLENQVTYATLHLTIREVLEETAVEPAHVPTFGEKIIKQFENTWKNTKKFFQGLVLVLIAFLPGIIFLGINAIIVVIIIKSIKKKRRKKTNTAKINEKIIPSISFDDVIHTDGIVPVDMSEPKKEEKKEELVKFAGDVAMNIDEKPKDIKVANIKPVTDYKEPNYKDCNKDKEE